MILIACSVRDAKSESFGRPFFLVSVGSAIRSFDDEVNREAADNTMYHHAADFALYQLGTFDDQDGSYTAITPKLLVQGNEVQRKKEVGLSVVR